MKTRNANQRFLSDYRVPTLLGALVWVSLILHPRDMWDGTIVSFAASSKNYSGIERLTSDADLQTIYFLFRSEFFLADFFHTKFIVIDRFIVGIAVLIICVYIKKFIEERCQLEAKWSSMAMSIFLTFPIWHILTSSTQTFYLIFTAMGLVGIHLVFGRGFKLNLVGFITLVISFEMNSLMMFVPVLAVIYQLTEFDSKAFLWRIFRPFLVSTLAVIYWIVSHAISSPSGQYLGYNKIVNPFSLNGWKVIEAGISSYSSFAILPIISISALICIFIFFWRPTGIEPSELRVFRSSPILFLPLLAASVLPYVLVSKSTVIDDFDWSGRHAILLSIPFAIGMTLLTRSVLLSVTNVQLNRILYCFALGTLLIPNGIIMAHGFFTKYDRQMIDKQLSTELKKFKIPPGSVEVIGMPALVPAHRDYESNSLFAETFGKNSWWTRIAAGTDPSFSIPSLMSEPTYQAMYIFKPETLMCKSVVTANLTRKKNLTGYIKTFLNIANPIKLEITSVSSKC